jgi:hypothetical protein
MVWNVDGDVNPCFLTFDKLLIDFVLVDKLSKHKLVQLIHSKLILKEH